jgi:hypothetical protein
MAWTGRPGSPMMAPVHPEESPMSAPQQPPPPGHPYPGGEDNPGYRWAFTAWVVLFLGVICLGLANYLGTYIKYSW